MAKVIIFTGAGISAESGIATFRDSDGLWSNHRVEDICSADSLQRNRAETIAFYDQRRIELKEAEPNHAHRMIQQLQARYPKQIVLITQNVDDLFEKAGCESVLHLHGFLTEVRCEGCGYLQDIGYHTLEEVGEQCPHCATLLRPNVVFFGEPAPRYQQLTEQMASCDYLVIIGTSGAVINMDMYLYDRSITAILNNLEPSEMINTELYHKVYYTRATEAIDEIVEEIEAFLDRP